MLAMIKKPDCAVETLEIKGDLKSLQHCVGGLIQLVHIDELDAAGIDMFINDEGKLLDLPFNFDIYGGLDYIVGNAVLVGRTRDGNSKALTAKQQKVITNYFTAKEQI